MSRHGIFNQTKVEGKKVQGVFKKVGFTFRALFDFRFSGASDQKSLEGWPPKSNLIEKIKVKN